MNRRAVLTAAVSVPALALAGSLPVVAAPETPVMALFRQWEIATAAEDRAFDEDRPEAETDLLTDVRRTVEQNLMATPCQTAADFICKTIACTSYGGFALPDHRESPELWAEARALVA